MAVSEDRKFTSQRVASLLASALGKTLGEIDKSNQFARAAVSAKITGIAGDVIEQSLFGYAKDSEQECDIEIDGVLVELKTTGLRVPKRDMRKADEASGSERNLFLRAKEGLTITRVTFVPQLEVDFFSSHFWRKAERLLLVFYEYKTQGVAAAAEYANFPIVGFRFNLFSEDDREALRRDWEIVRDFMRDVYAAHSEWDVRFEALEGFTHRLRPNLMLIELVPGFKKRDCGSYQKPRYRLKQTFVDCIVRSHFASGKGDLASLPRAFHSFEQLDARCADLSLKYNGMSLTQLCDIFAIGLNAKDLTAKCVMRMFGVQGGRLNDIEDFVKVGIIAKCVTTKVDGGRTEDTKLFRVNFEEWASEDMLFEHSEAYGYFAEHHFLCPIFCELAENDPERTLFMGFKRIYFDEEFIQSEVKSVWSLSRELILSGKLAWEFKYDKNGHKVRNASGEYAGSPNLPKGRSHVVFFRGGAADSSYASRSETVNGVRMLPQYIWLRGSFLTQKLAETPYL